MNRPMGMRVFLPALATALAMSGCGGDSTSGTRTEYAYVANTYSNTVSQYKIRTNGTLTPLSPATVATGSFPAFVAVDPSSKYVYVANSGSNDVWQYAIGTNGALAPLSPATVAAGNGAQFVTVHPSGKYAYVANSNGTNVSQYTIAANGTLAPMSPATVAAGQYPDSIAVDPSGKYAYVANSGSNDVSQFTISTSGALTPMIPTTVAAGSTGPNFIKVDSLGKYVYVTSGNTTPDGSVLQYTIGTGGALTLMSPAAVAVGQYNTAVAVDPSGKYAYVTNYSNANFTPGNICQYTIGTNGALTPMSPATVAAAYEAMYVTVDPSGKYAYAVSMSHGTGPGTVSQYLVGTDGALTPSSPASIATENAPRSIAIASVLASSSTGGGGGGGSGGGGIAGTWTGNYTLTTDFSYYCYNITTVTYSGALTMVISSQDPVGMLTGTVSMLNMTVASVNYSNGQCTAATLSPSAPIVSGGGFIAGSSVHVNTDLGPSFGSYWGTNQLLFFTGTLSGGTISGTISGMTDGGTSGSTGTFSVTKQ